MAKKGEWTPEQIKKAADKAGVRSKMRRGEPTTAEDATILPAANEYKDIPDLYQKPKTVPGREEYGVFSEPPGQQLDTRPTEEEIRENIERAQKKMKVIEESIEHGYAVSVEDLFFIFQIDVDLYDPVTRERREKALQRVSSTDLLKFVDVFEEWYREPVPKDFPESRGNRSVNLMGGVIGGLLRAKRHEAARELIQRVVEKEKTLRLPRKNSEKLRILDLSVSMVCKALGGGELSRNETELLWAPRGQFGAIVNLHDMLFGLGMRGMTQGQFEAFIGDIRKSRDKRKDLSHYFKVPPERIALTSVDVSEKTFYFDHALQIQMSKDPETAPELLRKILHSPNPTHTTLLNLVANPATPDDLLEELAKMNVQHVSFNAREALKKRRE